MIDEPLVTIGMPVFNGEKFIRSAIESILAQTFTAFELILSDNCSYDRTREICNHYAALDPRIKYIRHSTNLGAIANFNGLVPLARGRYFKWAASDDVCEPTYLQLCVEALDSRQDIILCHCDSDMIDESGDSWLDRMPTDDEEVEVDERGKRRWAGLPRVNFDDPRPSQRFAGVLLGTRWCVDSYGLIRTDLLRKTGLYPNIYGSEKVLMGELSLLGKSHQIPQCLFKQRIHTSASAYQNKKSAQQQFVAARDTRPFSSTRLSLLYAHLKVVNRARLSVWERTLCYFVLIRYVLQYRKWSRVAFSALRRKGVGGGGRRIIEAGTQSSKTSQIGVIK